MSELHAAYRKLALRVSGPLAGVVAVLLAAQLVGLLGLAWYQNHVAQRAETKIAASALAQRQRLMERTAIDYSTSNGTITRMIETEVPDLAWADENIAQRLIETRGMDMGLIVAPGNEITYGFVSPGVMPLGPDELAGGLTEILEQQRRNPLRRPVSGIVVVNGIPTLIAVAAYRRSGDRFIPGEARHLLLIGRNLDQTELGEIGSTFLLTQLKLVPKTDPRWPSVPLVTREGVELAKLVWTSERPGDALLLVALPLWGVLALGFGGLSLMIVRQVKSAADLIGDSEHRARHDALTGLPNRAHLMLRLDERCELLATKGVGFVVFYIDLDGFKTVNDRHGHEAGDTVLRQVAHRLQTEITRSAFTARLGGDEFAVILLDDLHPTEVQRVGRALIAAIERPIPITGEIEARISATIGTAFAPADGAEAATLLRKADAALYRGKREGKGQICLSVLRVA